MLTEIKHYIRNREQVSLRDLCLRFDTAPATMRDMLSLWIRKGKVKRTAPASEASGSDACGSCNACAGPGLEAEIYQWCAVTRPKGSGTGDGALTFFRCVSSGSA